MPIEQLRSPEMSASDNFAGVLGHRSSTPAPNEKVLLYLESLPRHSEYMSPTSKPPSMFLDESRLRMNNPGEWDEEEEEIVDSPMIYGVINVNGVNGYGTTSLAEVDQNLQDGIHSRLGGTVAIHSTGIPEPGPNDAPGPHYESYGSSWGNMGPLPTFPKTPSTRSRRTAPSEESDYATVTQENLAKSTSTRSRPSSKGVRTPDRTLSPRSQGSSQLRSRGSMRSLPKSIPTQKLRSVTSESEMRRGAANGLSPPISKSLLYAGRSRPPSSITSNPHQPLLYNSHGKRTPSEGGRTPRIRVTSPSVELDPSEAALIRDVIDSRRTSYALPPSTLEPEVAKSHFHDMDLCILLHQMDDPNTHEVVKKALRKAVRQRVKKLGMKHDSQSIKQYRNSFHDHDPEVHLEPNYQPTLPQEPPEWAKALIGAMDLAHQKFDGLDQKLESLKSPKDRTPKSYDESRFSDDDPYAYASPGTQTVNINTAQPTGYTMAETMLPATGGLRTIPDSDAYTHGAMSDIPRDLDDSPGQQYLEEELYKLRMKPGGSQSATHKTWELGEATRDGFEDSEEEEEEEEEHGAFTESGLPEIPDTYTGTVMDRRDMSLPPIPEESREDSPSSPRSPLWAGKRNREEEQTPPWQRIHQRILSWAVIWPLSEIDNALSSCARGNQVDEVALSIWSTQSYKRYVRSKMTDTLGGRPDRLFVPPNVADAISTAVFNGLHGDACGMLRDLWTPFGMDGYPRLVIVLAKHRTDPNHWVVHRFSLVDHSLTTYDTYPERTLPDGRPLGWWFAIRAAWPEVAYRNPDRMTQKIVRLHRPTLLGIDNAVAAGGIWRNILMGSRAERSLDLERLRDLISTEVKNLRQRKVQGKLSLTKSPIGNWTEDRAM